MTRNICVILVCVVLLVVVFVALVRDPALNICAESVRGYERRTAVELNATKSSVTDIEVALKDDNKYSQRLEDLTSAKYGILNSIDRQCKLLASCMRLSFYGSAKESCPVEYADYQERVDVALSMLLSLSLVAWQAKDIAREANMITLNQKKLTNLTNRHTSGATGGRVTVLRAKIEAQQRQIRPRITLLQAEIEDFLSTSDR